MQVLHVDGRTATSTSQLFRAVYLQARLMNPSNPPTGSAAAIYSLCLQWFCRLLGRPGFLGSLYAAVTSFWRLSGDLPETTSHSPLRPSAQQSSAVDAEPPDPISSANGNLPRCMRTRNCRGKEHSDRPGPMKPPPTFHPNVSV